MTENKTAKPLETFAMLGKTDEKPLARRTSVWCGLATALPLAVASPAMSQEIDISYGVDFTSNYISKGFTQTEDRPAVQPYVVFGFGDAYLEFWASNARFGGVSDIEFDVAIGYAPQIGNWDLDIGFVQYFYRDDKTDYGEFYLGATYNINDDAEIGLKYWREVYFDYNTFYLSGAYSGLPWDLTLSGGIGSDFGSRNLAEDAVYADVGLTKEFNDNIAFDLRVNHSEIEDTRLLATLSFYN
ncbi:TorF family putative porin [Seohaeicola saemankumensis]|nr:TorF family putative porin [Seohaeicola saemankumensis]MCA0869879.1 TorF family putative porin [Seohaeicola saemankumensis]